MSYVSAAERFEKWRAKAREMLLAGVAPENFWFSLESQSALFTPPSASSSAGAVHVSRKLVEAAKIASLHGSGEQWALLYRILWRSVNTQRNVLEDMADPDTMRLAEMIREVRHESHSMKALVRFHPVPSETGEIYVGWHEPRHFVLEMAARFFAGRYGSMKFALLTPGGSAYWDMEKLTFGSGMARAPRREDDYEELWRTYYASTFNPARVNPKLLHSHMPQRFWANLPEAQAIPALLKKSGEQTPDVEPVPPPGTFSSLDEAKYAARQCTSCSLCRSASQTVFGEGSPNARLVFVGEQPGDEEDKAGKPFVGPAGAVFDRALQEAGINRAAVYVTNAVKHFKWIPRGKRRLHQRPAGNEILACRPWLEVELSLLRPAVVVCLGSTASQSVLGRAAHVRDERGTVLKTPAGYYAFITAHPASILRAPEEERSRAYEQLVSDLLKIKAFTQELLEAQEIDRGVQLHQH